MMKVNSLVRQAAILAGASLFIRFIGFLYRIPLTALIGDEGNAFYIAAHTVYAFGMVITSGALAAAVSKLVSERIALGRHKDAHELFVNGIGAAVLLGSIVAFALGIGAQWLTGLRFFYYPDAVYALRALAPTVILVAIVAVFRGYFLGMKVMAPTAISQVVEQIFNASFSLLLAFLFFRAAGVELAAAGAAMGTGVGVVAGIVTIVGFYVARKRKILEETSAENDGLEKRTTQLKALFLAAMPILVGMSIYQIATFIDLGMAKDRIMASGAFTLEQIDEMVGQFTGKFILLTTLPVAMSVALSQAAIPNISSSKATLDKEAVRSKAGTALQVSMAISIPAAVGLAVLADPILTLLFPRHPGGGWLLRYGAISIVFLALIQVSTGILQGIGKFMLPVIAAIIGVLIKIPVNWQLMAVPEINILGAVISTLVCYFIAAAINLAFVYKYTGGLPDMANAVIKPIFAAAIMGIACFAIYYFAGNVIPERAATMAALAVGVPLYIVILWIIGGLRQNP